MKMAGDTGDRSPPLSGSWVGQDACAVSQASTAHLPAERAERRDDLFHHELAPLQTVPVLTFGTSLSPVRIWVFVTVSVFDFYLFIWYISSVDLDTCVKTLLFKLSDCFFYHSADELFSFMLNRTREYPWSAKCITSPKSCLYYAAQLGFKSKYRSLQTPFLYQQLYPF